MAIENDTPKLGILLLCSAKRWTQIQDKTCSILSRIHHLILCKRHLFSVMTSLS